MNIIHVMGMRSLKFGGLERFMLSLGKELHAQNHKLIILYEELPTSVFYVTELEKHGVDLIILPARGKVLHHFSITFIKLLMKYKPYIVHCHFDPAGYLALLISCLFRVKHRFKTLHSMVTIDNIEVKNQQEIPLKTRILLKFMYKWSTKIFSVSETIKIQFGQLFSDNSKIETIYLGVDDIIYSKQNVREKYDMPDKIIIACVAFHGYIKGIDILLEAISHLKNDYGLNNMLLYQIGGGNENISIELKNLTKELKIADLVIWMGQQDSVPEILSAVDLYCQPSRSEGIPLSIMEASIASLPIVASRVGGISEVVKDGITGFLVPKENSYSLAEKLHFLLSNEKERYRMGANARKYARENFVIQQQINKLLSLYF